MVVVPQQLEVLKGEVLQLGRCFGAYSEQRQRVGCPQQLSFKLFHVVLVDVRIAEHMNEFPSTQLTSRSKYLCTSDEPAGKSGERTRQY